MKLCGCGCGAIINDNRLFVSGHNRRLDAGIYGYKKGHKAWNDHLTKDIDERIAKGVATYNKNHVKQPVMVHPCECGCGTLVKEHRRFALYHHMHTEEYRKKHADAVRGNKNMLGKTHSEATRAILSQKNKGRQRAEWEKIKVSIGIRNSVLFKESAEKRKGSKLSDEHKEKISKALKGRKCTEETRKKLHLSKIGNKYPLGCKRSDSFKERIRKERTGKNNPLYGKKGVDSPNYGKKRSILARQHMSEAQSKYILESGVIPNNRSIKGRYYSVKNNSSIPYASSYELKAYEILEQRNDVSSYGRCKFYIPYTYKDTNHRYIPDIYVKFLNGKEQIIEVKSEWNKDSAVNKQKFIAAYSYCMNKKWDFIVWTEQQLMI